MGGSVYQWVYTFNEAVPTNPHPPPPTHTHTHTPKEYMYP